MSETAARDASSTRRVGLFGGAFDPPHVAHFALAQAAVQELGLDVLHVLPTGAAWHKNRALTAAADRLAMCRLAFGHIAHVEVDGRELERPGPSFTIDTLGELRAVYPVAELFLLIGSDQAAAFAQWHRWQEIQSAATVIIAARADAKSATGRFDSQSSASPSSGSFRTLKLPAVDVSATDIRQRVRSGRPIDHLVAPVVARYIDQHHLYQPT